MKILRTLRHVAIPLSLGALALYGVSDAFAATPARPPRGVAPPAPVGYAATPVTLDVAGIAPGAAMSVVDAKCKETGVKCVRRTRRGPGGSTLDRVRIDLPSGPYWRTMVTAKGGTVIGVRGRYRHADENRFGTLSRAFGKPAARKHGMVMFNAPNGIVASMQTSGRDVLLISPQAAAGKGWPLTPQRLMAPAASLAAVEPTPPIYPAPAQHLHDLAGNMNEIAPPPPTATVTATYEVPIVITIEDLTCNVEQDDFTYFGSDDPYIITHGTHTRAAQPSIKWNTFEDVNAGDVKHVGRYIFDEVPALQSIRYGEGIGVDITLREEDHGPDDEIDHKYVVVDYAYALANQNRQQTFTKRMEGDSGVYTLTYKLSFGPAKPFAMDYGSAYRGIDVQSYIGNYKGDVGTTTAAASLTYLPSKDPAYPNGVFYGTFTDGTTVASFRTTRLQGASGDFVVHYPNNVVGHMAVYFVGESPTRTLTGTITVNGQTRGFTLGKAALATGPLNPNTTSVR